MFKSHRFGVTFLRGIKQCAVRESSINGVEYKFP